MSKSIILRKLAIFGIFIFIISLFTTCDDPNMNPFRNDLGNKVSIEPPTITVEEPTPGAFIYGDSVIFKGKATAYIKVQDVQVKVFKNEENGQKEIPWTTAGINLSGSVKNKTWTFEINTKEFNNWDFTTDKKVRPKDGIIRLQFRVHDSKEAAETPELIYIIKNNPSDVKMTAPENRLLVDPNPVKIPSVSYGGEIQGQVIDRKGLMPGFPQIKIWPEDSFPGDAEPGDDDPQWGWATLFLPGIDDLQKGGADPQVDPAKGGKYADRRELPVVRASNFSYLLAEHEDIVVDPEYPNQRSIKYIVENGRYKPFGAGTIFKFRIRTRDTNSDSKNRFLPVPDSDYLEGYFPPLNFGDELEEDNFDQRPEPAKVNIHSADSRPTIEINNDDIKTNPDLGQKALDSKPNIWITEPTSKKIAVEKSAQNSNPTLFRLQLYIVHPNGIKDVALKYLHESEKNSRMGDLSWEPKDGILYEPGEVKGGRLYTFTAYDNMGIFTSSSDPYVLTVIVTAKDETITDASYYVYMDGQSPTVNILSVKGAASDPIGAAGVVTGIPGGMINASPYVVNGNIQVTVSRTDDSGIMAFRANNDMGKAPPADSPPADGYPMVKWYLEKAPPDTKDETPAPPLSDSVLEKLIKFKESPSAGNMSFFNDIEDSRSTIGAMGWVRRPRVDTGIPADNTHNFKINTAYWGKIGENGKAVPEYLWLYVIAQDQVQNLGWVAQKIKVDQSTDKPLFDIPVLFQENAGGETIKDENDLNVDVTYKEGNVLKKSGNWKDGTPPKYEDSIAPRNILERGQNLAVNVRDDDGIDMTSGGLSIVLTVLDPVSDVTKKTVKFTDEQVLSMVRSNIDKNKRDISLLISQEAMASALYDIPLNDKTPPLRDGMYKLEFQVDDDKNEKVAISMAPPIDGDTPTTMSSGKVVFYFAVSTELPVIKVERPDDNAWGSGEPIIIAGTVKSRLNVQNLWISFTPNVILVSPSTPNPVSVPIEIKPLTPAVPNPGPDGYYVYTWEYAPSNPGKDPGVIFNPTKDDGNAWFNVDDYPTRRFEVLAYDRLGYLGRENRTVQIDTTPPTVTLSEYNYGRPSESEGGKQVTYLYGKVPFTVSATDENGLNEIEPNSAIKWWVLSTTEMKKLPNEMPSWSTPYPSYTKTFASSRPSWQGGGNFTLKQSKDGRYSWIIDTRYLPEFEQDGKTRIEYNLCVIAMDKAGNLSRKVLEWNPDPPYNPTKTTNALETFFVDQNRDYPTIDENSLDPLKDSVKKTGATISGMVSDADFFNNLDTTTDKKYLLNNYVEIRFPTGLSNGVPTWSDNSWIKINIPETYSSLNGGIDPSGGILFKFKPSDYTTTDAEKAANTYLGIDGIKYFQIRVTDEPVGPTKDQKDKNAKWYGKNPDYFMTVAPDVANYPGYPYVFHDKVSRIFPLDTKKLPTDPDAYSFIVDDTFPIIFFDTFDPVKETVKKDGTIVPHPGYNASRPTFSNIDLLIKALKGSVQEYKLSDLSMSYSGKVGGADQIFRKIILNNPKDPAVPGEYKWNLEEGTEEFGKADQIDLADKDKLFKQIFDEAPEGTQIIVFEATDMAFQTTSVSYVFSKDTKGPEIIFNNISRSIERAKNTAKPFIPGIPKDDLSDFPKKTVTINGVPTEVIDWHSDWPAYRYTSQDAAWKAWSTAWKTLIKDWPSEYAFRTANDILTQLKAEDLRPFSTVIGDPEGGSNPPVITGSFSDEFSSIRNVLPVGTPPAIPPTYFYYRFKNPKTGDPLAIPPETPTAMQDIPPKGIGTWIKKEIEPVPEGQTVNDKTADWKILLNKANGFGGTDGENWVDIWVEDTAGNISDIYNVRFLVDRTPPKLGTYDPEKSPPTFLEGTNKDDFIVATIPDYPAPGWKAKSLPEVERVFSGKGFPDTDTANRDKVLFTLEGTVSDHNFSGITITIGQEGYIGYTVVAKLGVDTTKITTTNTTGVVDAPVDKVNDGDDKTSQKRLTLTKLADDSDGAPVWLWTLKILQKDVYGLRDAASTAADSARRYIRVTAEDKAGKRVEPVDWFFYLDTVMPLLEYTNLEKGVKIAASSFENENFTLSGLVSDDTRIRDVQYMIGRWDYSLPGDTNANWRWYDSAAAGTNKWTRTTPPPDAKSWPSVFASTDTARQTSMNWSIAKATIGRATGILPADLFEQEGYYRLDLYVTDFSLGNGNPHETYFINDAFDDARSPKPGEAPMSGRVFYIDKKDPTLQWGWVDLVDGKWVADPADTYNTNNKTYFKNDINGKANFSFTVGDGNTIGYWEVKVVNDKGETTLSTSTGIKWEAGSELGITGAIPRPTTAAPYPVADISLTAIDNQKLVVSPYMTKNGLSGGEPLDKDVNPLPTYTITITVKDGAGRTSSISKQFTLDNTPPRFLQDKFNPTSYEYGTDSTVAPSKPVTNLSYKPDTTTRTYSYDAVAGRMNIRGNTEDNSNQIKRVAFYVLPKDLALADIPAPKDITADATDAAPNGWHWYDPTLKDPNNPSSGLLYPNKSKVIVDGTTLMQIEDGNFFSWRIMVPQTSLLKSVTNNYVEWTKTGGNGINGDPYTAGTYRDVSINYPDFSVTKSSKTVPQLEFPDLNVLGAANPKRIYGGEDVGLLTVYVLAEDIAGNIAYDVVKYWIWPEGDRPIVTAINNPDETKPKAERLLNGTIRLSGMAKDNERVQYVWFRVIDTLTKEPYKTLQIPRWDEESWEAVKSAPLYQSPVDANTAPFNTGPNTGNYLGSRRTDETASIATDTGGWYMANGGGSREVSWWAYINTQGELEPRGTEESREFTVEVRAQDVTWDDSLNNNQGGWMVYTDKYRGLASVPKTTSASVVNGAPVFENPRLASVDSTKAEGPPVLWETLDNLNIRNRSAYKVTVKHASGLSAIRWSPTQWFKDKALAADIGSFRANPNIDAFNLLAKNPTGFTYKPGDSVYLNKAGDGYVTGTKAAAFAALTSGDSSMALTVVPKGTVISAETATSAEIRTEYDVFVDMRADLLLDKMLDPVTGDPDYGNGTPARAGQTKNSVRYPLYLSASEVSKATPLTTRGDALLPIDNLKPTGQYTLNRRPAGSAATIGGTAEDLGPVNGIARVVLWFQRIGGTTPDKFISWHEAGTDTGLSKQPDKMPDYLDNGTGPVWWDAIGRPGGGVLPASTSTNPMTKPPIGDPTKTAQQNETSGTGADWAIVIDTNSPSTGKPRWGHTLPTGFADGGKYWYVEINSLGMESGPVYLHYVVMDKAGNAKYYKERLVIMNGVAVIDRIKLGTDIRHNTSLYPANSANGKITSWPAANVNTAAVWPLLNTIRTAVPLGGDSADLNNDVKKGISDWVSAGTRGSYNILGANNIVDFNVRNNVFALRVETTAPPGPKKSRNFRLEYVSGSTLLTNANANATTLATGIKAGRVYIINDPGTATWGAIGAEGDNWQRGYAFIAAINGQEPDETGALINKITGTGSAWELNTTYYSTGSRVLPTALNLADVSYPLLTGDNPDPNAKGAEFVYGNSAFGTTAGSTIIDYTNDTDAWPPTDTTTTNLVSGAGNSMFILRVFDGLESDLFGDFTILRIRVNNNDRTKPFAQLYDINPKTEGQDRQNIAANEEARSLSPMRIGEGASSNRTKGGLWNISTTLGSVEKPGHIEPRKITYTTAPYSTQQHSLSSAQMGGAATQSEATIQKPWANPAGFFTTDTVSGKVVLRGYAEDDQRVHQVVLTIGSAAPITILDFQAHNSTAGTPGYGTAGNSANYESPKTGLLQIPTAQIVNGKPNVYFTDSIDAYRHRVEWAYVWDTETIPTTVVGDVTVQVRAFNRTGTGTTPKTGSDIINAPGTAHSSASELTKPNTSPYNKEFPVGLNKYSSISFNLRPYITGFLRNKTEFSHDTRSRQGRYMFYRGETAVVTGFNLSVTGTTPTPAPSISINGSSIATSNVGTIGDYGITAANANNQHYRQFTVGTGVTTGNGLVTYTYNQGAVNTGGGRAITTGNPTRPTYIQPWNVEYSPGIDGSQLWDDFTQAHIWQSNDDNNVTDSGRFPKGGTGINVFDPSMSIDPATGRLWSAHNEGGGSGFNTGTTKVGNNDSSNNGGNTSQVVISFCDPIINSDIFISTRPSGLSNNRAYSVWTTYSMIGRSGDTNSWTDYGGVYITGPQGGWPNLRDSVAGTSGGTNGFKTDSISALSQYLVESTGFNAGTNTNNDVNFPPGNFSNPPSRNQFKNPHIVTDYRDSNEHIHVSYYDTKDGSIKYHYNRRGEAGNMPGNTNLNSNPSQGVTTNAVPYAWTNLDGGFDLDDQNAFNGSGNANWASGAGPGNYVSPWTSFITGGIAQNGRIVNYSARSALSEANRIDAGEYNSIALTSQGYPVVAYYDKTNQKLKMAISNNVIPIAASNWTIIDNVITLDPKVSSATAAIAYGTGEYVSMKIDTRNNANIVHIAAMNSSTGNLVYVKGTIGTSSSLTGVTAQVVDSVGSVGFWCSLSLDDQGNPWISYQDKGYQSSRDGVKLAHYNATTYYKGSSTYRNGEDIDLYGNTITGWEAMHIPTRYRVENARLGMECYPARNYTGTSANKNWSGAVGYLSNDYFRIAYYMK